MAIVQAAADTFDGEEHEEAIGKRVNEFSDVDCGVVILFAPVYCAGLWEPVALECGRFGGVGD